jgi:predicted neutral ceramidase superfamily lipid hydrolase
MVISEFHPGPARTLSSNLITYTSAKCTVNELLMMGRGTA